MTEDELRKKIGKAKFDEVRKLVKKAKREGKSPGEIATMIRTKFKEDADFASPEPMVEVCAGHK